MLCLLATAALAAPAPDAAAAVPRDLMLHPAPTPGPEAYASAEAGEVSTGLEFVDGVAAGRAWAVAVMDVPVEVAWMAVNDAEAYAGKVGNLTHSTVTSGVPKADGRRLFQRLDLPIVADRWWVSEQHHNAALFEATGGTAWELSNATVHGSEAQGQAAAWAKGATPVAWSKGGWLLVPLGPDRTLVEYWVWTDPGGIIPAGPASRFAPGALRNWMADIDAHAQSMRHADRSGFVRPDQTAL